MFSDKKNILQLAALLLAHGVRKIVLCPGSRNAPIAQTLAAHPSFTCYPVTDERSAAFFALGMALHGGQPAAVCCTSGSALANMHPAVAETCCQQVPLVVISADRPAAWGGLREGQMPQQAGSFGMPFKRSVTLPDIRTEEDARYCNCLINEALLELDHHGRGPVHINVPVAEPFFCFTEEELPAERVITRYTGLNLYDRDYNELIDRLNRYNRRMIVAGQMNIIYLFEKKYAKLLYKHFVWLTEHTGNRTVPGLPVKNFDTMLHALPDKTLERLSPDLLVTYGGQIVSDRLKQFLRKHPPHEHWHVARDGAVADTFGTLTTVIEMDPFEFLEKIACLLEPRPTEFPRQWEHFARRLPEPAFPYSEMAAVGTLLHALPVPCALHLGNSSTVRSAALYALPEGVEVCSNRGANGIGGSLSTAIGYSVCSDKLNFVVIDDRSFFYDMNALWNGNFGCNLRILLLNNGGSELFEALPDDTPGERTRRFAAPPCKNGARGRAEERGLAYFAVRNEAELAEVMPTFTQPDPYPQPMLAEVFTDAAKDVRLLKDYYRQLKE